MNLLPVSSSLLRLDEPLPVAIRDSRGVVLLPKGGIVKGPAQLLRLMELQPHVQAHEHERLTQPWAAALGRMVLRNEPLGRIAQATAQNMQDIDPYQGATGNGHTAATSDAPEQSLADRCAALQARLAGVLRPPMAADFEDRLVPTAQALRSLLAEDADGVLLVLLLDAAEDPRDYGLRHSLLVGALVALVAQEHPQAWPADTALRLVCAALTMNVSILALQDQMANQSGAPSPEQLNLICGHGHRSAQMLREAGVQDAEWLEAVSLHHDLPTADSTASRWARLIHKADVFGAALSPRRTRPGMSATAAAKAAFLGAEGQADAIGSWIVKTVGLYPPGTLVTLNNDEVGVVCRRGAHPSTPVVASLMGASGTALAMPMIRDTTRQTHRVVRSLPLHDARVRVPVSAVLARRPGLAQAALGSQPAALQQRG